MPGHQVFDAALGVFRQAQALDERERKILDDMMQSLLSHRAARRNEA